MYCLRAPWEVTAWYLSFERSYSGVLSTELKLPFVAQLRVPHNSSTAWNCFVGCSQTTAFNLYCNSLTEMNEDPRTAH